MAADAAPPDVFTVAEAAAYLQVGERQIRDMLQRRELFGAKVGKAWRVSAADVRRLVRAETPAANADPLMGLLAQLPDDWRERLPDAISAALVAGLDALMTPDPNGGATRKKGGRLDLGQPSLEVGARSHEGHRTA